MLKLHVELPKPPIYGFPLHPGAEPTVVPVEVTLSSSEAVQIGAILAAWQVTLQLPVAGRSVSECWTWGDRTVYDTILTDVNTHGGVVQPGKEFRTHFTLDLPASLPPSTDNAFERIVHTIYVSAYGPAPEYQDVLGFATAAAESSKSPKWRMGSMFAKEKARELSNGKSKGKSKDSTPTSNDPLADAFGSAIGSSSTQVKYVTPLHERGISRVSDFSKEESVHGLGVIRAALNSRIMTLGSIFMICCRVDGLNPETTITTAHLRLEQQCASADGSEAHFDEFMLYKWFEPPDDAGKPRPLWPASSPTKTKSPKFPPRAGPDFLHLSALPRFPSPACFGKVTTLENTKLSTTRHFLIFEVKYYTPQDLSGLSPGEDLPEHKQRTAQLKFGTLLGDCTMSYTSAQIPRYAELDRDEGLDLGGCLEPCLEGCEPQPCRYSRLTWIVRDGKTLDFRRLSYNPERTREHQLETSSICMCFFEDTTPSIPPGGSYTDQLSFTEFKDDDSIDLYFRQLDKEYIATAERKHIPGFVHAYFSRCLCYQSGNGTVEVERRGIKETSRV